MKIIVKLFLIAVISFFTSTTLAKNLNEVIKAVLSDCVISEVNLAPNVIVSSGNLIFTDNDERNDNLTIIICGTNYRITDQVNTLSGGRAVTQIDPYTVEIPIASVTDSIEINAKGGDDVLTADYSGGNFSHPIYYDGGAQNTTNPGDILILEGENNFTSVEHIFINENDGSVAVAGSSLINYVGLEPVIDNLSVTDRIFSFTGATEIITLQDDGTAGLNFIDSTLGESVTFVSPTNSLTINTETDGGSGTDTINIQGVDVAFNANLTINAGADDTSAFNTNPTTIGAGSFDINAGTISASQNVSTTLDGAISFTATQNINIITNANISAVNGAITFFANMAGTLVGVNTTAIVVSSSAVRTTGSGNINFNAIGVSTGGNDFNTGILITSGQVENTGSGAITMNGQGGNGANNNYGIYATATTAITSNGGGITMNGTGGNGTGLLNQGILVDVQSIIEDLSIGNVTITGQGGTGTVVNRGVEILGANVQVVSAGGNIVITGSANEATTANFNIGVSIRDTAEILTTDNGNITINGNGGGGTASNFGLEITSPGTLINATDGAIIINGTGGNGSLENSEGIRIFEALIQATGNGFITLQGQGGTGTNSRYGLRFNDATITSNGGGISCIGQGGDSGNLNYGISAENGSVIEDTSTGLVSLNGTGGTGGTNNVGVVMDQSSTIAGDLGAIEITGTAENNVTSAIDLVDFTSTISTNDTVTITAITGLLVTNAGIPAISLIQGTAVILNGAVNAGDTDAGQLPITGNTSLSSSDELIININNFTTPGTDYDQLKVTGAVDVTGAMLTLVDGLAGDVPINTEFIIIDNDGADAVIGTFDALPEGTVVPFDTQFLNISYAGGDGNDVVLTAGTAPTAICQDLTIEIGVDGMVTILPSQIDNGSFDVDGPVVLSLDLDTFTCADIGANTVTLTVTDNSGSTATCTATVTVNENIPPAAVCQNVTVSLDAMGSITISPAAIDSGSTDNCGGVILTIDTDTFDCTNLGENNVVLTATDISGNSSNCAAIVTIVDDIAPTAICQDITIQLDANEMATIEATDLDGGNTDACGIANFTIDQDTFDCSHVGKNMVTLIVTDNNGNIGTCTAIVTVEQPDAQPPVALCQNLTVPLQADGTATIIAADVDAGSTGAGCINGLSIDIDSFSCDDVGAPIQITFTVTNSDGETDICSAFINVVDSLDPVITCPEDLIIIAALAPFELPDFVADGTVQVEDNCLENLIITQEPPEGTLVEEGETNIEITILDPSGNEVSCDFSIFVDPSLDTVENLTALHTLNLYPNPASSFIVLENPNSLELKNARLIDVAGRMVKQFDISRISQERILDISEIASASYFLIVEGTDGTISFQVIKR